MRGRERRGGAAWRDMYEEGEEEGEEEACDGREVLLHRRLSSDLLVFVVVVAYGGRAWDGWLR